jgi:hypothetical protein
VSAEVGDRREFWRVSEAEAGLNGKLACVSMQNSHRLELGNPRELHTIDEPKLCGIRANLRIKE